MPTYTYICPGCGYQSDYLLPITANASHLIDCPDCALPMTRQIGKGIKIKVTDYVAKDFEENRSPDWRPWDR